VERERVRVRERVAWVRARGRVVRVAVWEMSAVRELAE
jgi:hypothetical protein